MTKPIDDTPVLIQDQLYVAVRAEDYDELIFVLEAAILTRQFYSENANNEKALIKRLKGDV
jgi:hypothetical protein